MKYNKEKIEAAKILFAEILELNQKLPEDKSVDFHSCGMNNPKIEVIFWFIDENGDYDFKDEDHYEIYLIDEEWHTPFESSYAEITAKMQEWKELYCK